MSDEASERVLLQISGKLLGFGILTQRQYYFRPVSLFIAFGYGVAVGAFGLPLICLCLTVSKAPHLYVFCHHEGGIEPYSELADYVYILFGVQSFLEILAPALGYDAKVLRQLVLRHADPVVGNGQGAGNLIRSDTDGKITAALAAHAFRQEFVIKLIDGVAGVRDKLPEKYLPVCVDRGDQQVQEPFRFRFELSFCHMYSSFRCRYILALYMLVC